MLPDWEELSNVVRQGVHQQAFEIANSRFTPTYKVIRLGTAQQTKKTG